MFCIKIFTIVAIFSSCVESNPVSFESDLSNIVKLSRYLYKVHMEETVRVDIYYESLCPDCVAEYPKILDLMRKSGTLVDLHTYPYGNANTYNNGGTKFVVCQHGEAECYGNKLHACAIDILKSTVTWVEYNACLMANRSDDVAADECGTSQNIDSGPIKDCAKGKKGQALLIHYGEESEPLHYQGVPYVLVNGVSKSDDQPLWDTVCKAFKNPPKECNVNHN